MTTEQLKKKAAFMALEYIPKNEVLGIGTGSTVNHFIQLLAEKKIPIEGAVASSQQTAQLLEHYRIRVLDFNTIDSLLVYIDGADEVNPYRQLIKGGGGALTQEKILATASKKFICIVDPSKQVDVLGQFPVPIEVIPMARSHVAREILKMGGCPRYRETGLTDNGHVIIDVYQWTILNPVELEQKLNQITGIVENGIFSVRPADLVLVGTH